MDLKAYYQKIRKIEAGLSDEYPVVVSLETADGGRAGARTEVPRAVAARLVAEGRALIASPEETREFLEEKHEAKRRADQMEAAKRMQVTVLSEGELRALKSANKASK